MQYIVRPTIEEQLEEAIEVLSTLASWHILAASTAYPSAVADATDMIKNRAAALAESGSIVASDRLVRLMSDIGHSHAA